jgi:hypothetical protein
LEEVVQVEDLVVLVEEAKAWAGIGIEEIQKA